MYDSLKTRLNVACIVVAALLMWWMFSNHPAGPRKKPHPGNETACANLNIEGVKEGLIHEAEDDGSVVYVTDRWDQVYESEKDEIGYYYALCKSANEKTEIRKASDGTTLRTFVIDLDYRIRNGLPTGHLVPGQ